MEGWEDLYYLELSMAYWIFVYFKIEERSKMIALSFPATPWRGDDPRQETTACDLT